MKKIWLLGCLGLLLACDQLSEQPDDPYKFLMPAHFPAPTYRFENNPITQKGFELGKKLFNDPILSRDGSIACSNCHSKSVAFADPQHRLSVGIDDLIGLRNAPPLANLAFMKAYFWDGGVTHLDFVPINAIESEFEMGELLSTVVQKLNVHSQYPTLFQAAFPEMNSITSPMLLHSLSQYMNLLVSANAKYDQYIRKEVTLSAIELEGLKLFEQKCASCHSGALFTNQAYKNNGLDTIFTDAGRALISEGEDDLGKFRVPSLRNIALTAPYMHDGRFATLEEVLDHYSSGVKNSPTLAVELRSTGKLGIALSEEEKVELIHFLQVLTDHEFVANELF